jgi:hypothetical protein
MTKCQQKSSGVDVTDILEAMLRKDNERLLLLLGPAASGKTTLLKIFIMEILHSYADFVPVLIPVIEIIRMPSKETSGQQRSVVVDYLQQKYPQLAHALLQAMLQRRTLFLIDGMDESGTDREWVQTFVTRELLEQGHLTIITSRYSGYSSDVFKQCQLVELLPLTLAQQTQMVRTRVDVAAKADQLVGELKSDAFREIASNPLMLTMLISIYVANDCKLIKNRSELYEDALQTILGRQDNVLKADSSEEERAQLFEHLQKLASNSHERLADRRIFTDNEAARWIGSGWAVVKERIEAGKLPIIVAVGRNRTSNAQEYRFGHMSYQEFLTGREYYCMLIQARFDPACVSRLLGNQPTRAFFDVKQHLVLQLLSGIFSHDQLALFSGVIFGGKIQLQPAAQESVKQCFWAAKNGLLGLGWRRRYFVCNLTARTATYWTTQEAANSSRKAAKGCQGKIQMRQIQRKGATVDIRDVSGRVYHLRMEDEEAGRQLEEQFQTVAVDALGTAVVRGGDILKLEYELGRADAEALAPYLRGSTTLQHLVVSVKEGLRVLAEALLESTSITRLDVSCNETVNSLNDDAFGDMAALCKLVGTNQ